MRLTLIFRFMVLEDTERTPKGDFECASIMPRLAILLCLYFLPIIDVSFLLRVMIITNFHPPCFYFSLRLNNCPISRPESDVYEIYFVLSLFEVNKPNRIYDHVICVTSAHNKADVLVINERIIIPEVEISLFPFRIRLSSQHRNRHVRSVLICVQLESVLICPH